MRGQLTRAASWVFASPSALYTPCIEVHLQPDSDDILVRLYLGSGCSQYSPLAGSILPLCFDSCSSSDASGEGGCVSIPSFWLGTRNEGDFECSSLDILRERDGQNKTEEKCDSYACVSGLAHLVGRACTTKGHPAHTDASARLQFF